MAEGLSWADMSALRFTDNGELYCISERQPYHIFRAKGGHFELMAVNDAPPRSAELTGFEVLPAQGDATPRVVMGTRDHGLFVLGESGWKHLAEAQGLPGGRVNSLALYQGQLLVAAETGLLRLAGDHLEAALPGAAPSAIGAMIVEPPFSFGQHSGGQSLWLVGRDWVGRARGALPNFAVLGRGLQLDWPAWPCAISLAADRLDGLFIGHAGGLFAFHPGSGAGRFHLISGEEAIQSLLVDREGILWVATRSDLIKLASRRFATWTRADGLVRRRRHRDPSSGATAPWSSAIRGGLSEFDDRPAHQPAAAHPGAQRPAGAGARDHRRRRRQPRGWRSTPPACCGSPAKSCRSSAKTKASKARSPR